MLVWCEKFNNDKLSEADCFVCYNFECAYNCNQDIKEVNENIESIKKEK